MDIAKMSIALSQGQVQQQASMSVMKMAMGNVEQQGDALQKLLGVSNVSNIQRIDQPNLGTNIDVLI
ncbi:YjfB family protein [Bacillus marasmi]|uniref:YjfB family protein n=1 Tax=Bacillus marasmi TaxID=1926279 RepID=UPI0011CB33B5|nr:YjfB family protein [Bacillus marasmi]